MDQTRSSEARSARLSSDSSPSQRARVMFHPLVYRFARECGLTHGQAENIAEQALAATAHHLQRSAYVPLDDDFRSWFQDVIINRVINMRRLEPRPDSAAPDLLVDPAKTFERIWAEEIPQSVAATPPAPDAAPNKAPDGAQKTVPETAPKPAPPAVPQAQSEVGQLAVDRSRQHPVAEPVPTPPTPAAIEPQQPPIIPPEPAAALQPATRPAAVREVPVAPSAAKEPTARSGGRQAVTALVASCWVIVLIAAFGGGMAMGIRHRQDEARSLKADRRVAIQDLAAAQQQVQAVQDLTRENDARIDALIQRSALDEALALCSQNIRLYQALAADRQACPDAARTYRVVGDLFKQQGQISEALENHLRSLEMTQHLVRENTHNRAWQLELAWLYGCVGQDLQTLGFHEEALTHYKTRVKIHEDLANAARGEQESEVRLIVSLRQVAELQEHLGDAVAAQHTRRRLDELQQAD